MCSFDAEPCEMFQHSDHVARIPKKCIVCRWLIPKGAPYRKHVWIFEGDFGHGITCLGCSVLIEEFGAHHGTTPTADWFRDALVDCFDGANKTDPDAKMWRDAYAEILRRGRMGSAEVARG